MAKLIKKHDPGSQTAVPLTAEPSISKASRVIRRSTHEARVEAVRTRERASLEAETIVSTARTQAETLLQEAETDLEARREAAAKEGYESGKEKAACEWVEAIAKSAAAAQALEDQLVPQLQSIAITIARKILGAELKLHPEQILELIRQALSEKARHRQDVVLRVHPDDLERIRAEKASLVEVLTRCKDLMIREDESIAPHGVLIETEAGSIDAQLETQLAIFEKVLLTPDQRS